MKLRMEMIRAFGTNRGVFEHNQGVLWGFRVFLGVSRVVEF